MAASRNGFISNKLFLRKKINIIQEMRNHIRFFRSFHLSVFFHQRAVIKDHCIDTIVEFCKLRFLMQPLQNLLLCSSTARPTMDDIPFAILTSSNFISYSPPPPSLSVSSSYKLGKTAIVSSPLAVGLYGSHADSEDYYKFIEPPAQISLYFYVPFPSWLKYCTHYLKALREKCKTLFFL